MSTLSWVEIHVVDHCNNNCRSCHNFSPFSPERCFRPEDYHLGLDVLEKFKIPYQTISLMGGEPFLHPDLLGFARAIHRRYPSREILVTTNGFWLSEQDIRLYDPLWKCIDGIHFSYYPNMVHKLGGHDRYMALLALLARRHPHLRVYSPNKQSFRKLWFSREPLPVDGYCCNSQCTALLPDGRLARCGPGAYMHLKDDLPQAFRDSEHMFYDLTRFQSRSFWFWRARYPLDACAHCGLSQLVRTPWKVEQGMPYRKDLEAQYHLGHARDLLERGNHVAAAEKCRAALESAPNSGSNGGNRALGAEAVEAYRLLARTCLELKMADEAAQYLLMAQESAVQVAAMPSG